MNEPTRNRYQVTSFVAPDPQPAPLATRTDNQLPTLADIAIRGAQSGYSRQDDNAISVAKATLLVSAAYVVAALMITVGLLLIVWLFKGLGERFANYAYVGLLVWGVATLLALWGNRRQALHHTPSGIAHHELDVRERVARHAIDVHAQLLTEQWEREDRRRADR